MIGVPSTSFTTVNRWSGGSSNCKQEMTRKKEQQLSYIDPVVVSSTDGGHSVQQGNRPLRDSKPIVAPIEQVDLQNLC